MGKAGPVVTCELLTPPIGSNLSPRRFTYRCVALIMSIWPAFKRERLFRSGYCFDVATRTKYRAEFAALDAAGWHVTGALTACFDGLEALSCRNHQHRLTPAGELVRQALCPEPDRTPDSTAAHFAWRLHHEHGPRGFYPDWNPLEQLLRAARNSLEFKAELAEYAETIGEADCEGNRRGRADG